MKLQFEIEDIMKLAQNPSAPEHAEPCLRELYEAADDLMDYSATLPPIQHKPAQQSTTEETQ
jgi:hypothetical protein